MPRTLEKPRLSCKVLQSKSLGGVIITQLSMSNRVHLGAGALPFQALWIPLAPFSGERPAKAIALPEVDVES